MMIEHLIAATDLSECSSTAIAFADAIAVTLHGRLTIVHVASNKPRYATQYRDDLEAVPDDRERYEDARQKLELFVAAEPQQSRKTQLVVATGSPAEQLVAAGKTLEANLIVMGTRGHALVTRAFLGSVADEVIRDSEVPVLSIRCGKRVPDPAFRRIVCAVNYTGVSGRAFAHAIELASAFGARLIAIHIMESESATIEEETERLRAWVHNDVVAVEPMVLAAHRKASALLLESLKETDADLVVIGARRRIFRKKTTLGSTTNAITHRARCPVLTVSETEADLASPRHG